MEHERSPLSYTLISLRAEIRTRNRLWGIASPDTTVSRLFMVQPHDSGPVLFYAFSSSNLRSCRNVGARDDEEKDQLIVAYKPGG